MFQTYASHVRQYTIPRREESQSTMVQLTVMLVLHLQRLTKSLIISRTTANLASPTRKSAEDNVKNLGGRVSVYICPFLNIMEVIGIC